MTLWGGGICAHYKFPPKSMVWWYNVCLSPQHSSESWGMTKPVFLFSSLYLSSHHPPSSLSVSHLTYSRSIISCWVTNRAWMPRVLQFTGPLLAFLLHFLVHRCLSCTGEKHSVTLKQPSSRHSRMKAGRVWEKSKQTWESLPGNMTDSCSKWLAGSWDYYLGRKFAVSLATACLSVYII